MSERTLQLTKCSIVYLIRESSRAKRVRIAVLANGTILVTKPTNVDEKSIEDYVFAKTYWIEKKLEDFDEKRKLSFKSDNCEIKNLTSSLLFLEKKIIKWNKIYNFYYQDIQLKKLKTQWGYCTSENVLVFDFKILQLPSKLQDYVVVHEICHLAEKNHSKKYWQLVEKGLPDYKDLHTALRKVSVSQLEN